MKQFIYRINGQDYIVAVNKLEDSVAEVAVNGSNYSVELVNNEEELTLVSRPAEKVAAAPAAKKTATVAKAAPVSGGGAGAVKSPLPGIIVAVSVNVGDAVKKGQSVATLEAMKMENAIPSPMDGTVAAINVNEGDTVQEGQVVLTIE